MPINISCPGCGKNLKGKDDLAGKRVKCPKCGQVLAISCAQPAIEPIAAELSSPSSARLAPPPSIAERAALPSTSTSSTDAFWPLTAAVGVGLTLAVALCFLLLLRFDSQSVRETLATAHQRIQTLTDEALALKQRVATSNLEAQNAITATGELTTKLATAEAESRDAQTEIEKLENDLATTVQKTHALDEVDAETGLRKSLMLDLGDGVTMTLVLIPAGSFSMGSEIARETPVHNVSISKPFYLGKYEVTQEQWHAVMGTSPSHFKGTKLPVDSVSWNDCHQFLKKLASKSLRVKFSLPTEAQWEYACRAGSDTEYCFGDDADRVEQYAWCRTNSELTTHEVGKKQPNVWGLYDMHGNVWEWCQDWYGTYSAGEQSDPAGPSIGDTIALRMKSIREFVPGRVLRGGSWDYHGTVLRSADRSGDSPGARYDSVGFRAAAVP